MTASLIVRIVAVALAWAAVVAGARAVRPVAVMNGSVEADLPALSEVAMPDSGANREILRLARRAPFRASGSPSSVRYDPRQLDTPPLAEPQSPPKPTISLVGLVLDGEPRALIQGVPGATGAVMLGVGDTAGGLRVRRIQPDRVRVSGHDTTWTLELRRWE